MDGEAARALHVPPDPLMADRFVHERPAASSASASSRSKHRETSLSNEESMGGGGWEMRKMGYVRARETVGRVER